jgi:hypothetical protein
VIGAHNEREHILEVTMNMVVRMKTFDCMLVLLVLHVRF